MEVHDWLTQTKASDVMVRDVVSVRPEAKLADVAELLLHEQISGTVVTDESGDCVGVISANDILLAEEKVAEAKREIAESSFWNSNLALPAGVYAERLAQVRDRIEPAATQPVSRFMTTDLVSVREEEPLETLVRYMVDAHIHRVIVLEGKQLKGIVSTTDVLAALHRSASLVA